MTTLNLNVPRPVQAPRGAQLFGRLGAAVVQTLRDLVTPHATNDAAEVRALAHQYDDVDPRLAADLYAAADHDEAVRGV